MHSVTSNAVASAYKDAKNYGIGLWVRDTRDYNYTPSYYFANYGNMVTAEFKYNSVVDTPFTTGTYITLITITPWGDASGGSPTQLAIDTYGNNGIKIRHTGANDTWTTWTNL